MINDFKKARLNLVALYLCIIGSIIALFSFLIVYQANDSFSDPSVSTDAEILLSVEEAKTIAERLFPHETILETEYEIENGILYFTLIFGNEKEVKVDLLTGEVVIPDENMGIIETLSDDFEEMVVWIALLVFLLASLVSVFVANKTLQPIAQNIRKQKQFISGVAHELRNPLAALHARIESVLRSGGNDTKQEVLEDLLKETKTLIVLSEDLLLLEKGEERISRPQSLVIPNYISRIIQRIQHDIDQKKITVRTDISTEQLTIDPHDLEIFLYNLVHNAVKFTPTGGDVSITWRNMMLTIKDSGIGIAPEHIEHIFNRFYKANTARNDAGNGLGLALVKEIIERYHAKIVVSSTPGQGTTMSIQF